MDPPPKILCPLPAPPKRRMKGGPLGGPPGPPMENPTNGNPANRNSKYGVVFLKMADLGRTVGESLESILGILTVFWLFMQEMATISYHEYFNCLKLTVGSNPETEHKTFCHFDFLKPLRRGS